MNKETDTESTTLESYVAPEKAAEFLATTRRNVLEMARRGVIPGHPLPGRARHEWRFKLSELDAAMSLAKPSRNTITLGSPRVARKQAS